ncbi:hypothetical protein ACQI4F_11735 [Mycolicibacterium vaccae]|uniref:hypothetical protein n=1 Tax=Mycolicibacterium vaccae TaxID=1810 RepID=UPI003CEC5977
MPTSIDDAPAPETNTSGVLSSKLSALAIVAASIGTIAILFLFLTSRNDDIAAVQPVAPAPEASAEPTSVAPPRPSMAPTLPPPAAALPPPAAPLPPAGSPSAGSPSAGASTQTSEIDGRGFVGSKARCDSGDDAVVTARTARAAIVICQDRAGDYEYRGVRLQDGAALQLDDVRPIAAGYEARNADTTYRLSPTELVVLSGETLQSRDAIVAYQAS